MNRFSSHSRAERWIAIGRVALAGFAFLASNLDPSEPARHARVVSILLDVYVGYALIVLGLLVILRRLPKWLPVGTQVIDVAVFLVLMYFTGGPRSLFFVCLTFSLVCAMLRWRWRKMARAIPRVTPATRDSRQSVRCWVRLGICRLSRPANRAT